VGRVPGCGPDLEPEHPVPDDLDSVLRDRSELAPEPVEVLPVKTTRASLEAAGVDEMWGADLADVDPQLLVLAGEEARRACMVEVDVREQQVAEVPDSETVFRQAGLQRIDAGRRSTIDQRRLAAGQQVGRDDPGVTEEVEVEELRAVT
jgi:hypothetical protein